MYRFSRLTDNDTIFVGVDEEEANWMQVQGLMDLNEKWLNKEY